MSTRALAGVVLSLIVIASLGASAAPAAPGSGAGDEALKALISQADLHYTGPTSRPEAGLPIGNGRMGSLLWTSPTALHLQINRVDVFGCDASTNSFPQRHSDYCAGCGFVDIEHGGIHYDGHIQQQLSCYDGSATIDDQHDPAGNHFFTVDSLASDRRDVIAVKLNYQGPTTRPFVTTVRLRMLRAPVVKHLSHTATSKLSVIGEYAVLTQEFVEGDYYCASAVAVSGSDPQLDGDREIIVNPGDTVYIASAATFDRKTDVAKLAIDQLKGAEKDGFDKLRKSNAKWWHDFWSRNSLDLHSADGVADRVAGEYHYFLYIMGSTSRGKYPPKFNGMLWAAGGDTKRWGGDYWGANQACFYDGLFPANRLELYDPMFDMYSGMAESCALAAKQEWGSQGIYIPETVAFNGMEKLPEPIAAEMRDLYLVHKPWSQHSPAFADFARTTNSFASRWNWKLDGRMAPDGTWQFTDKGGGAFGHVSHIFSRGAKIAYQYWLRYEYGGNDMVWLRDRAYPMVKGVAEFYRNFPNLVKEADGKYHIHHVNDNEALWDGSDTAEEMSAMRGIFPVAIRAAELLNVDADLRAKWREVLDNLAPMARSDNPAFDRQAATQPRRPGPPVWVKGIGPTVRGGAGGLPDGNTMPQWFFELCTLECDDPAMLETAKATFNVFTGRVGPNARAGTLSKIPSAAAKMGRADLIRYLVPGQLFPSDGGRMGDPPVLANRMTLREGPQTTSVEHIGNASEALLLALCQSVPPHPGGDPVIHVFPAWPKEWDASFHQILCRGGFVVSSTMKNGEIGPIEITSPAGGECRIRNPWGEGSVTVTNGNKSSTLSGSLLKFETINGQTYTLLHAER